MHTVVRTAADGKETMITREYFGEPRHLQQATRLALAQVKVYERAASGRNQQVPVAASPSPTLLDEPAVAHREVAATPPVRACSAAATEQPEVVESAAYAEAVTVEQANTCGEQSARRAEFFGRLADVSRPVQLAEVEGLDASDDEPDLAATLPIRQPLNRKERRKRQRLLARALARRGK